MNVQAKSIANLMTAKVDYGLPLRRRGRPAKELTDHKCVICGEEISAETLFFYPLATTCGIDCAGKLRRQERESIVRWKPAK